MQFNLLDNGIDSLKASGEILLEYYGDNEFKRHQIKDAIFHFMHGVEIISKFILKEKNEELIFKKQKEYTEAKEIMKEKGFRDVFEANPEIRTIDIMTAVSRVRSNTSIKIDEKLYCSLNELRIFRNQLTHYTVDIDDDEFVELVNLLRRTFESILFLFKTSIEDFKNKFDSINRDSPLTEYDQYMEQLEIYSMMAHEEARLDYEADRDEALERM